MKLSILNIKGGASKTTLAINLLAKIDNASMISSDITANLSFINKRRSETSLKHKIDPENVIADIFSIYQITFDKNQNIIIKDHSEIVNKAIETSKETLKKNIIFDIGGYDTEDNRKYIAQSDIILIPTGINMINMQSLKTLNSTLKSISIDNNKFIKAKLLPSNIHSNTSVKNIRSKILNEIENFEHLEMTETIFWRVADYEHAFEDGYGVSEISKYRSKKSARIIQELVDELNIPQQNK